MRSSLILNGLEDNTTHLEPEEELFTAEEVEKYVEEHHLEPEPEDDDNYYEVEKIVSHRFKNIIPLGGV